MRKLFCEYGPICYSISLKKEIIKRHLKNCFSKDKIAKEKVDYDLPFEIMSHTSILVRKLYGVDEQLQISKIKNIEIASSCINGIIIKPNEVFSFWDTVGKPTKKRGFQDGLVIYTKGLGKGIGGGLCQMANMVHWLVLHTPLEIVELHHHTDALFPDDHRRVPFGTGTSVAYNNVDYCFKNNTDHLIQLVTWIEDGFLCGEIRSDRKFDNSYDIVEEDNHFSKEGNVFYRNSKVYKIALDKDKNIVSKEMILNNHSKVLYDYEKIPKDQIRYN